MPSVASIDVALAGDIGGVGVSRWHFQVIGGGVPLSSDCNNASSAVHGFYTAMAGFTPQSITFGFPTIVEVKDVDSGAPTSNVLVTTVPGNVAGGDGAVYAAGVGARVNWKTSVIKNRRFVRGAVYYVPLGGTAYNHLDGAILPTPQNDLAAAATAYLNAMTAAGLSAVVYSRPKLHQVTGGSVGAITSFSVPNTPCGVRSRRS